MNKLRLAFVILFLCVITSFSQAQSILNVKVFIQGFYDAANQNMKAVIDPVNQPLLFDTITVKLADATNGAIVFSEKKVFDIYGNAEVTLPAQFDGNSYYIVLNHRNSIATWSANPVLINGLINYDFTTAVTQAYGDNLKWMTNAACIYTGDINQDGFVDIFDYLIFDPDFQNMSFGNYLLTDMNGDGAVDLLDYIIFNENLQSGVSWLAPFVTGVESHSSVNSKLLVYPNPATDFININTTHTLLYIYSADGKLVSEFNTNEKQLTVDVSSYPEGLYIMKAEDNKRSVKFMVHH